MKGIFINKKDKGRKGKVKIVLSDENNNNLLIVWTCNKMGENCLNDRSRVYREEDLTLTFFFSTLPSIFDFSLTRATTLHHLWVKSSDSM